MTAKEQLRQVVDVMGEEEAGRVLQLLCSPAPQWLRSGSQTTIFS